MCVCMSERVCVCVCVCVCACMRVHATTHVPVIVDAHTCLLGNSAKLVC